MPFEVTYQPQDHYINARYWSHDSLPELEAYLSEIMRMVGETGCNRTLSDLSEAILELPLIQSYTMPDRIKRIALNWSVNIYAVKRAIVIPMGHNPLRFFETVSYNRGQFVRTFHNMDEARVWLFQTEQVN